MKYYRIIDILHSGHSGEAGTSKVGKKYDNRRGQIFELDERDFIPGRGLILAPVVLTTPFEKSWSDDQYFYIQTMNSIYKCELVE